MSDRFYTAHQLCLGEVTLDGEEAHHLANVRRFGISDSVILFNGDGKDYPAEVIAVSKRSVTLQVTAALEVDRELGFDFVVASALPKGDRADYLIEKLTELGVSRFVPLITARSIVQPKDTKLDKFHRAVIEASKQCGRNRLMAVDKPESWTTFVKRSHLPLLRFVMHTDRSIRADSPSDYNSASLRAGLTVAVGSEGGLTSDEIALAGEAGWRLLHWGQRVMRIETAATAVAAWVAAISSPASATSQMPL